MKPLSKPVLPLLAFLSSVAQAQIPAPPTPVQRVEVQGQSAAEQRRNDTAARITVGRDELARFGDSSLSEVLKRQPGISVVNGDIRMRGLGAGYTQILVNGEPVAQGFTIDSIAPSLIDRIEIMRSGSAEFGAQAIAGTINVILKKPGGRALRELTLSAVARPGYPDPSASLRVSDKHGQLAWSVGADLSRLKTEYLGTVRETSSAADGALTAERSIDERNYSSTSRIGLTPRLTWTLPNNDKLEWVSVLDRGTQTAHGAMSETVRLGDPTQYPDNSWRIASTLHSERSDITWTHTVGTDGKLLVKAGVNRNTRDNDYLFTGASNTETLARSVLSDVIDNTASLSGKYLAPLGQAHSLGLGWDAGRTSRSEFRLQRDTTFGGALLYTLAEDYQAAITRLAVFAQDEWQATPRLQVYLGARWEGLDTAVAGRTLDEVRARSSVLSPVASLLWKLPDSEKDQLRLSLSRTYKAPTSRMLVPRRYTTNNDSGPNNPDSRGNPALRPELAWGVDAGYERYFGAGGMVSISAYGRKIDQVTVQTLFQENGVWMSSPFNSGSARAWGIEFDTKTTLGTRIDLRANAARNWSRLEAIPGPDNRLTDQVAGTVNAGLDYRYSPALTMGVNFNLQFGGTTRLAAERLVYSAPQRTLDAYALWKLDKTMKLRLSGANLLAREEFDSRSYRGAGMNTARDVTVQGRMKIKLVLEKSL